LTTFPSAILLRFDTYVSIVSIIRNKKCNKKSLIEDIGERTE